MGPLSITNELGFFFPTEAPVVWRHNPAWRPSTPEKGPLSGPPDVGHSHDGESLPRACKPINTFRRLYRAVLERRVTKRVGETD